MIYVVNIITILLAIIYAIEIATEKKKYQTAFGLIGVGFLFYIYEAITGLFEGKCEAFGVLEFIKVFDTCVDYSSGALIMCQAMIIGGFTVVFISFIMSKKSSN